MNTFEITIQRKTGDRWPIVVEHTETNVLLSERSEGDFYLSTEDFQQLISLQGQSQEFGTFLGKALFKDEIRDAFVGAIKKSTESLRVLLFLEAGDRELRTLRWERLCAPIDDGWKMLALDRRTPFSHYIPAITDRLFHPIGRRDLRVLIFVASPSDSAKYQLAKFDVIASVNSVKLALGEIPCDVMAVVDGAIAPPTLDDLCLQLTNRSQKYTLLHFVSHGRLLDNGDTALYWSKADNTTEVVTATRLIERLRLVGGTNGLPHFTFLCTCESASPEAEGALGGLGQRLVRDLGMPAVIAMTDKVTIKTAQVLAENFYKQLRVTGEVDLALQEATASLAERQDVTVPVLFSRLGGKPLFSDQLDRKLTNAEIQFGLERLKQIVTERAPILQSKLQELENQLITTLNTDVKAISSTVNQEREQALIALNNLSQVASDLSFHGVALGKEAPIYDSRCPFLGLYPFRTKDREFFFGREKLVAELQQKLLEHNFLAVLGASGSGKSSLVLAGLVPTLQDKYIGLNRAILTPNSNPVEQLTTTLAQVENKFAIIVVDQFEELFTLCNDQSQRQEFIQQLLEQAKLRRVVITLRADFLADCAAYPELKAMMESHQKLIGPMETAELRKSMELQAAQVGIRFELGLINTILDDLDDEPGAMPLLQHTLLELWKRRHGKWLCYEEYEAIGGVQHAIAQTADEIYHQLSVEEQEDFQNIFIRLTRLDDNPVEGEKPRDTRRRVSLDELVLGEAESHHTHELLKMLTGEGARLVIIRVNPATQLEEVEVAHEALIRHWPRLINWLAENRTNLQIREAIRQTALDWAKNQKDDSYLVHKGERLNIAQTLSEKSKFLNQQEAEYVLACVKLSDRLSQEQKQRAIRERRLIFTIGSSIVIVVVITALLAIVVKLWQREALNRALSGSEHSSLLFNENRQLKSLIEAIKAGKYLPDPDEPDPKVITALENVVYGIREKNRLVGHDAAVNSVAFDPDSEILASASTDKTIKIWDIHGKLLQTLNNFTAGVKSVSFSPNGKFLAACSEDGTIKLWNIESINDDQPKVIENPTLDQAATVTKVVFSPDSKFLAASGTDGSIKLWDLEAPDLATQEPRNFSFGDQEQQIVFSPDSQTIITVNIDNNINALNPSGWKTDLRILQLRSGNQTTPNLSILLSKTLSIRIKSAESHKPKITTVALSPDGKNLAIGDQSGHITLADLKGNIRKTLMNIQTSDEHRHGVNQIVFSPDSKTIATANEDNYVRIWHIEDGNLQEKFLGHKAEVKSVAFSPDGTTLISAGSDDLIILWSISGKILHNYSTKGAIVTSAVLSPDDKIIAFAVNNVIKLRDSTGHLLHTLEGHKYEITQVVFNPNLTQNLALVSSSKDRTIKLWDIRGNLLKTLSGHKYEVNSVAISPDGSIIASGSDGGNIRLWSAEGEPLHILVGHKFGITSVAFGRNILASTSKDETIKLWNLDGKLLRTIRGHTSGVTSVAFSPDGKTIASAGEDHTVRLWNLQGKELKKLSGHQAKVNSVVFSPDGETVASASEDQTIRLWDIAKGKEIETFRGHAAGVTSVVFNRYSNILISTSRDGSVKFWRPLKKAKIFDDNQDTITSVAFSPNENKVAASSYDKNVKLWDVKLWERENIQPGKPLLPEYYQKYPLLKVIFSPNGKKLIALSDNRFAYLLDSIEGSVIPFEHRRNIIGLQFSPNGEKIASFDDKTLKLWDLKGNNLQTFAGHQGGVTSIAFNPDGKSLASGSHDKTIKLWNLDGTLLKTLSGHQDGVTSIAFNPRGNLLASASQDKTVKLWDLKDKNPKPITLPHESQVMKVAFSPDGNALASVSENQILLWDINGKLLHHLKGHESAITDIVFSPSEQTIASASEDKTIKLWNLAGELLHTFYGHNSAVTSIAFNPKGNLLASGSSDNTVRLWELNNIDFHELMIIACSLANDYLQNSWDPDIAPDDRNICSQEPG